MPKLFSDNHGLCITAQFFHFYFGMMNMLVLLLLVEAHRSSLLTDQFKSRSLIQKYGHYFFLGFPCITLIPYMMDDQNWMSMSNDDTGWCALTEDASLGLQIGIFYLWVWIALVIALSLTLYTGVKVTMTDSLIGSKYFSTVGLAALVSVLSWIPRSLERAPVTYEHQSHFQHHLIALFPINLCGVLLGILFFMFEKRSLQVFQDMVNQEAPEDSMRMTFTWEAVSFDDDDDDNATNTFRNSTARLPTNRFETGNREISLKEVSPNGTASQPTSVANPLAALKAAAAAAGTISP